MTREDLEESIFESYYKRIGFTNIHLKNKKKIDFALLATNRTRKISDPIKLRNSMNYFLKKKVKNLKSIKNCKEKATIT